MTFYEDIIKPWGLFLLDISKEVANEELRDIKLVLGDKLAPSERDEINNPVDLLERLEVKGLIGEDNTALLRELFSKARYEELIPSLDKYEVRRRAYLEQVSMLAGRRDPLFVGRDSYIREILDFFKESRHLGVRCVCLWGMAGSGKTKLGAETCAIYLEMKDNPKPSLVMVDLNKKDSVNDVGMAFLSSVGQPVEANKFDVKLVFNWMQTCTEEYIFLFDNADDLLKPTSMAKDHFQTMLKQMLEWPNKNIKIIITSRYAVNFAHLNNLKEIEVQSLEMKEAVQLLFKSLQQGPRDVQVKCHELLSEEQAIQLSNHCGNNPQALRAVASQLRSGKDPENLLGLLANPMQMEKVLSDQSLWGLGQDATQESARESNQVLKCLSVMFEDVNPVLKLHLMRLAVLPGLFSQTWGLSILSDVDQEGSPNHRQSLADTLQFELDDVAETSLLLRESLDIFQTRKQGHERERKRFYSMHPLVRCLCLMKVEKDENMKRAFQAGMVSFINESFQQLRKFTTYDDVDACGSWQRLEKERANITQYLELEMRQTFSGKPHPLTKYLPEYNTLLRRSNMAEESNILAFMERFMFPKERAIFFHQRAAAAHMSHDMPGWVNHQGWYADQLLQLHEFHEAEIAIAEPLSYCQNQVKMLAELREGYSQCLYVKANLLIKKPQARGHIENNMRDEGIKILQECIRMRDQQPGNGIVRARSINSLGSAYFKGAKFEEALEQHKEALEVLKTVTQGHPETHPDYTFFLTNIGTCYHELGYIFNQSSSQEEKGKRYFKQAICTFEDVQKALRGVGHDKMPIMATVLKNLAMTYCEMKQYRVALDYADRAAGLRVKILGNDHPDVARAHYFVGSLYMSLGDEERKNDKMIFEIEEYKKAQESFDRALIIEFKVGYERRSLDYGDLKRDVEKLFNILAKEKEWQRYSLKFKEHEKGLFVPVTELEASSSSSAGTSSAPQGLFVPVTELEASISSSAGTSSAPQGRKRPGDAIEPTGPVSPEHPPDPKKLHEDMEK